ncbi:DNA repair protein RadC [Streptococcus infantis SK1302]|uniref:DNA repair protein RadC n=1 Tax=Streptococcus infantis SK1302 TaxID=871237 RepID=A0ABN0B2X2_9STRE|nr:DNA repair protein RadC [Streptococcus infantis SK1302]
MYSISFQEDSLLPRERLVTEGVECLSNQELLAILLRTGTRQSTVFEIAQKSIESIKLLN